MSSNSSQPLVLSVLGALILGCAEALPTGFSPGRPAPQYNFSNGPAELANVFRFEDIVGGGFILDPEADLILWVGLPENPADASVCSGAEDFDPGDIQLVGLLREVLQVLIQAEVHIHIYRLSTFSDFCTDAPLAQGFGRFILNDNDVTVSGARTNSFGVQVTGPVTLAVGGTAQVSAHARFLIDQDGSFTVATSDVHLSR